MTMWVYRDKDEEKGRGDYWLSLEPPDHQFDPEDETVEWFPYDIMTCGTIGPVLWEKLGGKKLELGEIAEVPDLCFSKVPAET